VLEYRFEETGADVLAQVRDLIAERWPELEQQGVGQTLWVIAPSCAQLEQFARSFCLREWLAAPRSTTPKAQARARVQSLHVRFDGADLGPCSQTLGLSVEAFMTQLCQLTLTVRMLGFLPGFPYLDGLPQHLRLPRRTQPRTRVAAGTLAMGGPYLGVYPHDSPGGWQLLGSVRERLWDSSRQAPSLLRSGDRVQLAIWDEVRGLPQC
jgi:allophanate hydrolase subunit 1